MAGALLKGGVSQKRLCRRRLGRTRGARRRRGTRNAWTSRRPRHPRCAGDATAEGRFGQLGPAFNADRGGGLVLRPAFRTVLLNLHRSWPKAHVRFLSCLSLLRQNRRVLTIAPDARRAEQAKQTFRAGTRRHVYVGAAQRARKDRGLRQHEQVAVVLPAGTALGTGVAHGPIPPLHRPA